MTKQVKLTNPAPQGGQVWGIAAQMPIWRLGYFINQALEIGLKRITFPEDLPQYLPIRERPALWQLFEASPQSQFLYEDLDTHSFLSYQLCTLSLKKLPTEARVFQYFLIIYPKDSKLTDKAYLEPNAYTQLLGLPDIQAIVELSHIEPINQLLS